MPESGRLIAAAVITVAVFGAIFAVGTGALPVVDASNTSLPGNLSVDGEIRVVVGGENTTVNGSVPIGDTPPAIEFAIASDSTDADGIVSNGDTILVSVTVVDSETGVDTVTANASAFGVDSITLSEVVTGTYSVALTVDGSAAAANGSYPIRITANDTAGNTAEAKTNTLQLGTTSTCVEDAVSGSDNTIDLGEIQDAIDWWAKGKTVPDTGGETISLSEIQSLINAWADGKAVSCS